MLDEKQFERISRALPFLKGSEEQLIRDFKSAAFWARLPVGREVFSEGDECQAIALVVSGVVRVYKIGETGREITLYRFGQGESCILTANAILSAMTFPAIAVVEKDVEAAMVPASVFSQWVRRYDPWREFVFGILSQRLSTVMAVVDEVAFKRMDERLVGLLLELSEKPGPLRITHQEIAHELGSSREVISRLLEDLVNAGVLRTSRGQIEILDREVLSQKYPVM